MRLRAWPLLAATALLTSSSRPAEDGVALLQTAGRQNLEHRAFLRHKEALDRLLEQTELMLKKGASEAVIALAEETLKALKAEVLPMIEQAHKAQSALLAKHYQSATSFISSYESELQQLTLQRRFESAASEKHKACRIAEHGSSTERRECSDELAKLWEKVEELEEDLTNIGDRITEDWCQPGVNTSENNFRDNSVRHFDKYSAKREKVRVAWKAYEDYLPHCHTVKVENHEKNNECDLLQQDLEESSCLSASLAGHATQTLKETWPVVDGAFQDTVQAVTNAMEARKHEYSVLKVVECLIEKIKDVGGKPCEDQEAGTNETATKEIEHCHSVSENVTHLDILIPELPPAPVAPEVKPEPCGDDFIAQEYEGFPEGVEVASCRACRTGDLPQMMNVPQDTAGSFQLSGGTGSLPTFGSLPGAMKAGATTTTQERDAAAVAAAAISTSTTTTF